MSKPVLRTSAPSSVLEQASTKNHNHFTPSTKTYNKPSFLLFPAPKMSNQDPPNQNLRSRYPSRLTTSPPEKPLEFGSFLHLLDPPPPPCRPPPPFPALAHGPGFMRVARPHQIIAKHVIQPTTTSPNPTYAIELRLRDLWAGTIGHVLRDSEGSEVFDVVKCEWGRYTFVCAASFYRVFFLRSFHLLPSQPTNQPTTFREGALASIPLS